MSANLILAVIFCCLIASAYAGTFVAQDVVPRFISDVTNSYLETPIGRFSRSIGYYPDRAGSDPLFASLMLYGLALAVLPLVPVLRYLYLPFLVVSAGIIVAAFASIFQSLFLVCLLSTVLFSIIALTSNSLLRSRPNSVAFCFGVYAAVFLAFDLVAYLVWDYNVGQWLLLLFYQLWAIPTCAWAASLGDDDQELLTPGIQCGGLYWFAVSVFAPLIAWAAVPFVSRDADA